jgi:hypothetical protein
MLQCHDELCFDLSVATESIDSTRVTQDGSTHGRVVTLPSALQDLGCCETKRSSCTVITPLTMFLASFSAVIAD